MAKILIFAASRTGSNLLCDLLNLTGEFGLVEGFWVGFPENISEAYPENAQNYMDTHAGKHFAAKISWAYLDQIQQFSKHFGVGYNACNELLKHMTHFIFLHRRDLIAQAVSWHITTNTKQFSSEEEGNASEPEYDFDAIAWYIANTKGFNERTRAWMKSTPQNWLELVYEDYIEDFTLTMDRIYAFLGEDMPDDYEAIPTLQKQDNPLKDEYIARFRKDLKAKKKSHMMEDYQLYEAHGFKIWLDVNESLMMQRRSEGTYELGKVNFIKKRLKPGDVFIDIGANKGYFTSLAASIVSPGGFVYAYEPNKNNADWLRQTQLANHYKNSVIFNVAVGNKEEMVKLHLMSNSGQHSILPLSDDFEMVEMVTIDSHGYEKVDMIKIDVQGAELGVLKGASDTLKNNHDVVLLMDLHPQLGVNVLEVTEFLRARDFLFFDMRENPIVPTANTRELLARREHPKWVRK